MKKNLLVSSIVFITACSTTNKINTTYYETRQQPINKGSIPYNPVIADLKVDVDKKITGTAIRQVDYLNNTEIENTKQQALYNAITNSGADLIIDPIFKITANNNDGRDQKVTIQAEVSGFYGKYTNVHKMDIGESNILQMGQFQQTAPEEKKYIQEQTPLIQNLFKKK